VAVPLILLATLALGVTAVVLGIADRSGASPHWIARSWSLFVLRVCGIRINVDGEGNIPLSPAIFAANHASAFDIPILFGRLPLSFRIIYKRSLALLPFVGWHLFLGGHIAIDRGNPFKARKSLELAAKRIRSGTSVVVFPEGTRSADASIGLFKRGSFLLAIDAGVPIVPVSLVGVKRVVPHGVFSLKPGPVAIRIHPPVPPRESREEAEALAAEVRDIIVRGCEEPLC